MMLPADFETFSRLIKAESGLSMTPDKAYLLDARLRPVARKWNLSDLGELAEALRSQRNAAQIRDVAEAMTVNESFFFRDAKPFDQFRDRLLPMLLAARASTRKLRIWSAAASSGQEAYSVAMLLQESGATSDWTIDIVGTDISTKILERAKAGTYSSFEVQRGLPAELLVKYFTRQGDRWQIADSLRHAVQFVRQNLLHDFSRLGMFDIVFCRNVLIYFDLKTKEKVLAAIRRQMPADGYLFLGAAETVLGVSDCFTSLPSLPGVFVPNRFRSGPAPTPSCNEVKPQLH
jgi:chemotaxis protein methyltransferase CheR